jgi:hypothetical protein
LWSKRVHPAVLKNFISNDVNQKSFFLRVPNSLPYRRMGTTSALWTMILEIFCTKVGFYMTISFCINLHENTTDILHITVGKHKKAVQKFCVYNFS